MCSKISSHTTSNLSLTDHYKLENPLACSLLRAPREHLLLLCWKGRPAPFPCALGWRSQSLGWKVQELWPASWQGKAPCLHWGGRRSSRSAGGFHHHWKSEGWESKNPTCPFLHTQPLTLNWGLLIFLDWWVYSFHQIWKCFDHHFFKSFVFSSLSSSLEAAVIHILAAWSCPIAHWCSVPCLALWFILDSVSCYVSKFTILFFCSVSPACFSSQTLYFLSLEVWFGAF